MREHLEAAIAGEDVGEVRRLVRQFDFSEEQRRQIDGMLDAWERELRR